MTNQEKFVVRGDYPQRNKMGGFGSEAQSEEIIGLEAARQFARASGLTNKRIYRVQGDNGAEYPLVEKI